MVVLGAKKKEKFVQAMFGIVINGRPAMFPGTGVSGITEQSPGKWTVDIASPGEVRDSNHSLLSNFIDRRCVSVPCFEFAERF